MKRQRFFSRQPLHLLQGITSRRNAMLLLRMFIALFCILVLYSLLFHSLMHMEGRNYSIVTGLYWTFSTMSTLGVWDITFQHDAGKLFTILVVCTGILFLLVLLPFTIFQLFQSSARIPRELPKGTHGHVVLTEYNPLTSALVERLQWYNQPYAVLVSDLEEVIQLREQGIKTVAGKLDDPNTFKEIRIEHAALLVATGSDITNTSLAYTVRRVSENIPIIASTSGGSAVRILERAGCTHVLALDEMMGQSLAAELLKDRDIDFRIIEKSRALILDDKKYIHGDAIDIHILERSGFFQAPAVAVTTHSDPINIYITTYLRYIRKDIQIISRATLDRNIQTLHSAGCDFVISHASLDANNIFNLSKRGSILMIAEGVDVFRVKTPKALVGKTIKYASIREKCGCSVIGISANGSLMINPYLEVTILQEGEMILIGCVESEEKFFKRYRPVTVEQ